MRKLLLAVLAGVLLVTGAGTAAASRLPQVIRGNGPTLHPEGVAWDPTRQAFLIGSYRHGTVSVVGADGQAHTLVNEPRMTQNYGVHVDAVRKRLLVAYQGGVGIFDLATGRTLHLVKLPGAANDLAVDWAGNAYATVPPTDTIYRIDPAGRAFVQAKDPKLADPTFGLNGIVWHPAGFLLTVQYSTGKLLRVSLYDHRIDEVRLDKPLVGGDGLALRPDGSLIAVTNKLGVPGEDAVTVLKPQGLWSSAKVTRHIAWPISGPTVVALTPYGSYVVNGRLDWLIHDGKASDEFFLTRV